MAGDGTRSFGVLTEMSGFLLSMAQAHVYRMDEQLEALEGLSTAQLSVLTVIHENPGIRHGEVAEMLVIKLAYMTKLLKGFESSGWVERQSDPADRRAIHLSLTPEGEAVVGRTLPRLLAHDAERPNGLTPREIGQLKRLLTKYLGLPERDEG
ncbi:MarR family winged helix-turn-helix transcriptional regulator [Psychromarinibacter sp. S121]|uniref:MarR family winged helix-turn-helix transcriptional regulator n=1 Tax=Psychromarinibacter sp. S121 TaxID=3415127 RepID=UPI003C7CC4EE